MALFGRKRSSIGLDIGSGFVKVVEVDHSGDQPEVVRVAMRPLAPDAIVEGEIMDYGLVSEAVQGLFRDLDLKGADVVTAVGGHDVIIKKIEMDRMKEADAREVIRWEAEQGADLIINATPLGLEGSLMPVSPGSVQTGTAVLDLTYRRGRTPWVKACRQRGLRADDGMPMLVEQGALAFVRWFGMEPDREAMWRAVRD
jgi:hypothetical protein